MQSLVFASRLTGWNCTALPMKNRAVDVPWVLASSHPGVEVYLYSDLTSGYWQGLVLPWAGSLEGSGPWRVVRVTVHKQYPIIQPWLAADLAPEESTSTLQAILECLAEAPGHLRPMYLHPAAVHLKASHTFTPASSFSQLSFSRLTTPHPSPRLRHISHPIPHHGSGTISLHLTT